MSNPENTSSPESSAVTDALETLIDSRIDAKQPTTEELARAVAPLIEIPDVDPGPAAELSDGQLAQVREEISAQLPDTSKLSDGQLAQVVTLIQEHTPDDGGGSGSGSGGSGSDGSLSDEYREKIDKELLRQRVSSDPTHTARIETGVPSGVYHDHGDWGNVITVHEPVHWESAVIDAESEGMTRLRVRRIDFERPTIRNGSYVSGGKYELQGIKATREIDHGSGPQEIYPGITLFPGHYFVDRDPEAVVPMRKIATGVNFDDFNESHDIPVEVNHSWRGVPEYTPGGPSYEAPYLSNEWHRNIYYFGNLKFSYMGEEVLDREFQSYGSASYGDLSYNGDTSGSDSLSIVEPESQSQPIEKGG